MQNLVTKAPSQNLPSMLVAQMLPFAKSLCGRKWTDEDILEDVQFLRDELKARFDSLTYVYNLFVHLSGSELLCIAHGRSTRQNCNPAILLGLLYMNRTRSGRKMPRSSVIRTTHNSGMQFAFPFIADPDGILSHHQASY